MFFAIATAALVAFVQVAHGARINVIGAAAKPDAASVTTAASFPIHELAAAGAPTTHTALTSPAVAFPGLHSDAAQQTFPATLLLCPSANCASCFGFDLSTLPVNVCLTTSAFSSVAISQPSNVGIGFVVGVGQGDCANFVDISLVNTCFDITQDAQFTQFALNDL